MAEMSGFLERAKRELSAEEVSGLKTYSASTDRGKLLIMPIIRKMGAEVQWVTRVHIAGASGPLPTNRASLQAIGAPSDWADKAKTFVEALQSEYPALIPGFTDRRSLLEGKRE